MSEAPEPSAAPRSSSNNWMVKVSVTFEKLKFYYVAIPSAALIVVFLILKRYPLTQAKLQAVREELEKRREAV